MINFHRLDVCFYSMLYSLKSLTVAALGTACLSACVQIGGYTRASMESEIVGLPDYCVYEETPAQFADRVRGGDYWTEQTEDGEVAYLMIGGDGCVSVRLFILSPDKHLYILMNEWEDAPITDSLSYYCPLSKELKNKRCDIPKSILNVDGEGLPTQVWQKLKPYLAKD